MLLHMLKGKIHRATVTQAELNYVGSITVDEALMEAAGIREYEKVAIVDVNNSARFEHHLPERRCRTLRLGRRQDHHHVLRDDDRAGSGRKPAARRARGREQQTRAGCPLRAPRDARAVKPFEGGAYSEAGTALSARDGSRHSELRFRPLDQRRRP